MSWSPLAGLPNPIIVDAAGTAGSGYVLKCYLPGTTTSTSMAIDAAGSSPQTSITANADGIWEVSSTEVIPHIDRKCKWGIFANSTDATANTPFYQGPFDNIEQLSSTGLSGGSVATKAALTALTGQVNDEIVDTIGHTVDNAGGHSYYFDSSSSATDDSGTILAPDSGSGRWLARNLEVIPGEIFGLVGDGDGAGGGTDDSTAMQLAFDYMVLNDCTVELDGNKIYRLDSALSLELTATRQTTNWELRGNNCVLDFSNMAGATIGITVGDSTQTYLNDKGSYAIYGVNILGPENTVPVNETVTITTFIGIFIVHAIRVHLENVECTRCYIGIKTAACFPLTAVNVGCPNNFIGVQLDDVSNLHTWINLDVHQCWYSILIIKSDDYSTAKIGPIRFINPWVESSKVGVHIDPGTTGRIIRGISFDGGFYKDSTYDVFRIGQDFTFSTPQTRGTKGLGKIFELDVNISQLPTTLSATLGIFAFTSSSNCFGFTGRAPLDDADSNTFVNAPSWGDFLITGDESAGKIANFKRLLWKNEDEYRLPEVPHTSSQVPVYIPAPDEPSPGPYAGTFTPTITFATAGDLSVVYSTQVGTYTKIGRFVCINFSIQTSTFTHTTASGNFRILGIPHNPRTLTSYAPVGQISYSGITKATYTDIALVAATGSSVMTLSAAGSGVSRATIDEGDVPTAGTVILAGTLCYETDA